MSTFAWACVIGGIIAIIILIVVCLWATGYFGEKEGIDVRAHAIRLIEPHVGVDQSRNMRGRKWTR